MQTLPSRPGHASSSAGNGRTRMRSCGSPTSTTTGSPRSLPTLGAGRSLRQDTSLRNLPLKGVVQNQLWAEIARQ
jgi:hypothetical protein